SPAIPEGSLMRPLRALEWAGNEEGYLRLLDQTRLPAELVYLECRDLETVRDAICRLAVRGAPAIGVAAAYGLVLHAQRSPEGPLDAAVSRLGSSRPTAVNLHWALARMRQHWQKWRENPQGDLRRWLLQEAHAIAAEDEAMCAAMGKHGATLIR